MSNIDFGEECGIIKSAVIESDEIFEVRESFNTGKIEGAFASSSDCGSNLRYGQRDL
ncbi:hypothetical protein ACRUMN_07940 [Kluyvera cryocrescens]|uniref:hypothetical protein n=1 Tax=Kluyvera cryocrescens TaxID=580 RepID=UPI003D7FEBB8